MSIRNTMEDGEPSREHCMTQIGMHDASADRRQFAAGLPVLAICRGFQE